MTTVEAMVIAHAGWSTPEEKAIWEIAQQKLRAEVDRIRAENSPPKLVECWAVINDYGEPVQCYATLQLAQRHLAGNFNTPLWRVARLVEH
jgi:hypothetical protein